MKQSEFKFDGSLHTECTRKIQEFCDTFGINQFARVQDGFMTAIEKRPVLDIIKLDKHLGHYEGSMDEFVEQEYGKKGLTLINSLI